VGQDTKKKRAAEAAINQLQDGIILGVGTGSTINFFIDALASHAQHLDAIVSSSEESTARLEKIGITVSDLASTGDIDLYIDGADEATQHLHLIKGGGGALTREKILAGAARRFVCIVDDSKTVGVLGRFPLPIEVIPMARSYVARQLFKFGGQPIWRENFVTDNGNQIIDVHGLSITNPPELEKQLNQIPGVVTVGLFAVRSADTLLIASDDGIQVIE
jgi:ribose 5-phosphate isomerase A